MTSFTISETEGRALVLQARSAVEAVVKGKPVPHWSKEFMSEVRGVFVTLNTFGSAGDRLRGCIGFPYPSKRLGDAVTEAALAAATEDPRFSPLTSLELETITVEVSVLTSPKDLNFPRRDLPSHVRIGKDGLIVSQAYESGLLLPQVATEFGLDQVEFLTQACMKASLPPDAWLDPKTRIQVFQAEIFAEKSPRGEVVRVTG